MRVNIWRRLIFFAMIAVMAASVASADVILSLEPSSQSVTLGSQATVNLNISGLGDPPSLGTFDLNVGFDPTVLSFDAFSFGDPVLGDQLDPTGGGNTFNFINPGGGTLELFELSLDGTSTLNSLQASAFTLGVLTFDTPGGGTSSLSLSINALGDADGNLLSATVENGNVTVIDITAVPEPSSVLLVASIFAPICVRRALCSRRKITDRVEHQVDR